MLGRLLCATQVLEWKVRSIKLLDKSRENRGKSPLLKKVPALLSFTHFIP